MFLENQVISFDSEDTFIKQFAIPSTYYFYISSSISSPPSTFVQRRKIGKNFSLFFFSFTHARLHASRFLFKCFFPLVDGSLYSIVSCFCAANVPRTQIHGSDTAWRNRSNSLQPDETSPSPLSPLVRDARPPPSHVLRDVSTRWKKCRGRVPGRRPRNYGYLL